VKILK